jgi:BirA family biotin operon repressor/biotin-[acetyl-CoA-carboxylase] ligase
MSYFNMIKLDATASSNDWLKEKLLSGSCVDGQVVWVNNQTKGRGQRSKTWVTDPGKNLTFSLLKQFPSLSVQHSFLINCAVTLSIVAAVKERIDIDLKLKWPNDILSGKNKIGGVLIENMVKGDRIGSSIIGIGINVNQDHFEGLSNASSLILKTGLSFELGDLLNGILKKLQIYLDQLVERKGDGLLEQYENYLFEKGKLSSFQDASGKFQGTIIGVTKNGLLKIQKSMGEVSSYSHGAIQMIF